MTLRVDAEILDNFILFIFLFSILLKRLLNEILSTTI